VGVLPAVSGRISDFVTPAVSDSVDTARVPTEKTTAVARYVVGSNFMVHAESDAVDSYEASSNTDKFKYYCLSTV